MAPEKREEIPKDVDAEIGRIEWQLGSTIRYMVAPLAADRDNLQSKLTACEAKLKAAAERVSTMYKAECWVKCQYCDAYYDNVSRDARITWGHEHDLKCTKHPMRDLEKQLAAATAPVVDAELEKAIERLELFGNYLKSAPESMHKVHEDLQPLIRAARQRGKVSADAVKLAEMVKDLEDLTVKDWLAKYGQAGDTYSSYVFNQLATPLCNSILAQAAAVETASIDRGLAQLHAGEVSNGPDLDAGDELVRQINKNVPRVPAADLLTAEEVSDLASAKIWLNLHHRNEDSLWHEVPVPKQDYCLLHRCVEMVLRLAPRPSADKPADTFAGGV